MVPGTDGIWTWFAWGVGEPKNLEKQKKFDKHIEIQVTYVPIVISFVDAQASEKETPLDPYFVTFWEGLLCKNYFLFKRKRFNLTPGI